MIEIGFQSKRTRGKKIKKNKKRTRGREISTEREKLKIRNEHRAASNVVINFKYS